MAVLVALLALPVKAPVNPVEVTEVKPANVVTVLPKLTAVDPIVTLLLVSAPFGIFVKPAPEPAKEVAVNCPVEGTKVSFVEVVFWGKFPVFAVTHVGKTDTAVARSSVMAVLVALLAVVAFPVKAPVNPVEVTEVNPAKVVEVPPNAMFVVPMVRLLFDSPPFGILVNPAPEPTNPVAVRIPVLGMKLNLVVVNLATVLPAADVQIG